MNWLHYLAEANLYLAVFYLAYQLLLAKETYNQLNRVYLLFSCVAAFTLPVLQLGVLKPAEVVTAVSSYTPQVVYPIQPVVQVNITPVAVENQLTWEDYLIYAYALGCAILLLALLVKLFVLIRMILTARREQMDQYTIIYLPDSDVAFSFFNYLFIGTDASGAKTIITHELVHINQKHSLDILFVELIKIINWFNPFIYLLQNSLKAVHEYIADERTAAQENDTIAYATFLVNNAYGAGGSSITHSFFNYSLLKKRIIMLHQKRSGTSARLKYLIAAPICAALLCVSTLAFSKDYGFIDLDPAKAAPAVTAPTEAAPLTATLQGDKLAPPPPPMVTANGYDALSHHLYKNISYHPAKTDKGGVVLVSFNVTGDHKVTDAQISKSAGNALDAIALNAMNSYKLTVKDKAGKNYIARFYFYNTDYSIFKNKDFPNNNKLDIMVSAEPHAFAKTSKGYEYQIYDHYEKNAVNGKLDYFVDKVVIFEKDGEAKTFTTGTDDFRAMGKKYGFSWPGRTPTIKFPPPIVRPDKPMKFPPPLVKPDKPSAQSNTMSHDSAMVVFGQFMKDLGDRIKYHIEDRKNNNQGRVIAVLSMGDNGQLKYLSIVRSISNAASEEVFNNIKNSPLLKKFPKGNWTVPVTFSLAEQLPNGDVQDVPPAANKPKENAILYAYNPDNITMPLNDSRMLNELYIRGYLKNN